MPKLPIDYKKSLIYKLCCNNTCIKDIYIGSTTDFTKRKYQHKYRSDNPDIIEQNFKVYQFIRENNGWDNWSMVLVEYFPCESKLELKKRERYWIETLESKLNSQIPTRTKKEWEDDNKDKIIEKRKQYYKKNIDKYIEKRVENKDKMDEYNKQYYINNADIEKERQKKYYTNNIEKIKKNNKEKITCECSAIVCKTHITRHRKTDKHLKLLQQIITP